MKRYCLIFLFLSIGLFANVWCSAIDEEPYPFTNSHSSERFVTLTQEVRCIVCQNQSLSDSSAPLAQDLRRKIYHMILEDKTDAEIKEYLAKRYGEFIFLRPRFNKLTMFLWLFPFLAFCTIAFFLFHITKPINN